jgi:uncharacterized protein YhaN
MKHKNSYRFTRFTLSKAPGFLVRSFGDLTALHPGLNILTGANGVGKTTIIKALWSLLYTPAKHPLLEAEGVLQRGETEWFLSLSSRHLEQKRISDGLITSLPGRNDTFADAYWFPLHELLTKEGVGEPFLEAIRKEMQGGIDLERAVREAGGIEAFSRKRHTLVQTLKDKQKLVKEQQAIILENLDLRQNIADLQHELGKSEYQAAEKIRLETLLEYLSTKKTYKEIASQLKSYHPVLENMTPHSLAEARTREHDYEVAKSAMQQAKETLRETEGNLASCNIEQSVIDDQTMPRLIEQRSEALNGAKSALDAAKREALRAQEARSTWESAHQWLMEEAPDEQTLENMVKRLHSLAYSCELLRCHLASSEYVVRSLGEEEPFDEGLVARLKDIKQQLTTLVVIAARKESLQPTTQMKQSIVSVLSLLTVSISAILGYLIHPGISLIAIPLLVLLFIIAGREKANPLFKEVAIQLKKRVEQVNMLLEKDGQIPLDSSDAESISRSLGMLTSKIVSLEKTGAENIRRRSARKTYDNAQSQWNDWLQQWEEAASDLNLSADPALEGAQFFHFGEHLQEWVHRQTAEKEALALLRAEEKSFKEALEALQKLCNTMTSDVVELRNIAATLATTINDARRYTEQYQKDAQRLKEAIARFKDAETARSSFYANLTLAVGDIHTLERLDSQVAEYQEIVTKQRLLKTKLEGFPNEIRQEAENGSELVFSALLDETIATLEKRKEQERTLWEWERTYRELCNDTVLENAELECLKAEEALDAVRQDEVARRMVYQLYEQIKEQSERTYQPQVLQKASTWLQRITHNRYLLTVGEAGFLAQDTVTMRPYALDQLSSGTRIQLLFSLRMAFIEMLEGGGVHKFPIFFDELMANSDDERSLAIAEAIVEIAKQRQVFYCTAQKDEVRKLDQVAQGEYLLIDLEDEQRDYQVLKHPFEEVPLERESLPPFEEDYLCYAAACKVPRPELWESLGSLSSWYLCTASKELEALLSRGFALAGQARSVSQVYAMRFNLLSAAQKLARKGRPKVLSTQDLDDEALSLNKDAHYYAALIKFLKERPRDGNEVLLAIAGKDLKGFREPTLTAFDAWLHERGYASEETPYALSEILERLSQGVETLTVSSDEYMIVKRYLQSLGLNR